MVINGIIDLDNGELLEATGKHRISALDIQGSETAELKLTFYKNGSAVTDNSVVSGAVIDFGVKADADYTGTSYLIYHDTFSASTDGLEYSGTPTWATAEVETALGNESSVKLHGQVKVVISGVTYYSQVFEVEIHNNVIQAAGTTNSVIYPRLIQSTSDPTVNDDSLDGYGVSSLWLNTSSNAVHVLMDNTAGAAVWAGFLGLTNGQLANNLVFNDDLKAVFGSGPNLEIYSTGSASYIKDIGTGSLYLSGGGSVYIESPAGETMAKFQGNGSCDFYYDNQKKLETTDLGCTVTGKLIVSGDLDVDGTTTTFNSTVVTVDDPVFGIGGDTAPGSQDNKDRGVSFRYHDGASAKVGFYGWDNSENAFTFLTDTNDDSTEVFSGTLAVLKASKTLLEDGSASAPSVSFSSDNDTGIYLHSTNTLAFSAAGQRRAYVDSNGIWSTGNIYLNSTGSLRNATDHLNLTTSSQTNNAIVFSPNNTEAARFDASGRLRIGENTNFPTGTAAGGKLDIRGASDGQLIFDSNGSSQYIKAAFNLELWADYDNNTSSGYSNIIFKTDGDNEAARFDSSGRLGIGYTSMIKELMVNGSILIANNNGFLQYDGQVNVATLLNLTTANTLDIGQSSHVDDIHFNIEGTADAMILNSTGLGIGGTPQSKLHIVGGDIRIDNNQGYLAETAGGGVITAAKMDGSDNLLIGDGNLVIDVTGTSELMRLDGSASSINVPDNVDLKIGSGNDLGFGHDGINSTIYNTEGDLRFIQYKDDKMIRFYNDNGSGGTVEYFRLDGGEGINIFSKNVKLIDSIQLNLGGGNDLQLYHDGSNSYVTNATGDMYFINSADDKDIAFMSDDGSGGFETYFYLDGSASSGNPITVFPDNSKLTFGNSYDLRIFHDGDNKIESHGSSDLYFKQQGTDQDFIFEVKPSGVSTEILRLDGSTGNVGIGSTSPDKTLVVRGTDAEIVIDDIDTTDTPRLRFRESGSTSGYIETNASNLKFYNGTTSTFTMHSSGDAEIKTDGKGLILNSPDGTAYKITVANDGTVTSTAV